MAKTCAKNNHRQAIEVSRINSVLLSILSGLNLLKLSWSLMKKTFLKQKVLLSFTMFEFHFLICWFKAEGKDERHS